MTRYIGLLRAVNLGAHNQVAMAGLRTLLTGLGFDDPRTLLQSGNVVFGCNRRRAANLETLLETEVEQCFGVATDFFVRTAEEWRDIVAQNPFAKEAERDPAHLVVMVLKAAPSSQAGPDLQAAIAGREVLHVAGRHAYIVYPDGIGRSRLTTAVIEKKLGTRGTGRNWNTVLKLHALVGMWFLAALLSFGRTEAQGVPQVRQVRWPLLDIVMVPDSAGLWLMAAPNPATTQWQSEGHLVRLGIDPVLALQWATVARQLIATERRSRPGQPPLTPSLRDKDGPEFVVLAVNPKKASANTKFVLVVSDSAREIRWKSFASFDQVDALLTTLEATARSSRDGSHAALWNTLVDRDPDTPVSVVSQPRPAFPSKLASQGRIGRVWMSFVVSAEGRADQASFFTLLSDDSLFTAAAISALLRGRYRPAVTNGQPVPQRVFQAIQFRTR